MCPGNLPGGQVSYHRGNPRRHRSGAARRRRRRKRRGGRRRAVRRALPGTGAAGRPARRGRPGGHRAGGVRAAAARLRDAAGRRRRARLRAGDGLQPDQQPPPAPAGGPAARARRAPARRGVVGAGGAAAGGAAGGDRRARHAAGPAPGGHRAALLAWFARGGDRGGHERLRRNGEVAGEPGAGGPWQDPGGGAMTDLEERVRDALRARAGEFTVSADAWERTTARAGRRALRRQARRPARQRWLTRFTPLAAAAAVLVIGAGSATLAGTAGVGGVLRHVGLGPDGNTAPRATPSPGKGGGADRGAACAFPGMPKKIPVSGVPISAKVTVDNVTTWWTRIPKSMYPQVNTDLSLCQAHGSGGSGSPVAPLGPGQLVQASTPFGGLNDGMQVSGVAVASVTSVEADLANGSVVRGWVAYGRGFPYAAWWLTYPEGIAATLVFRDAA